MRAIPARAVLLRAFAAAIALAVLLLVAATGPRTSGALARSHDAKAHHKRSSHARKAKHCRQTHVSGRGKHARRRARCTARGRAHKPKRAAPRRPALATADRGAPATQPAGSPGRGWGGFGAHHWPGASWRPYASSSPFNRPVGGAAVHPGSAKMVARVLSWNRPGNLVAGVADTPDDYGHPVYYAQPGDPVYRLHVTEPWGRNPVEGMRIPVPAGARPAGGSDAHMTIVTPNGWEYDLWEAERPANGALNFGWGGRLRVDGNGTGAGAGTAAQFGNLAGIIRPEELAAGHIDHALFVVLKCTSDTLAFGYGEKAHAPGDGGSSYVYPALKGGSRCGSDDADAPPMGARFQLAMSDAQIAALSVPAWKQAILTALAHYGGFVGDTGGPGFALEFQSSSTYTSFGVADPLVALARQNGISPWNGEYAFNLSDGVDWARYLRVVVPPSSS